MPRSKNVFLLEPNWYGLGIDLRALWNLVTSTIPNPKTDTLVVAERFLETFENHAVPVTQIPRIVPGLTLSDLRNPESLLPVLKTEMLQHVASFFKIELGWLEGHRDQMYHPRISYKHPKDFLEDASLVLEERGWIFPIIGFRSVEKLNNRDVGEQGIVIAFVEKCLIIDNNVVHRYIINDLFDWGYWKSRIQLKAMIRTLEHKYDLSVPVYLVSNKTLQGLENGTIVPRRAREENYNKNRLFLEDYVLGPNEHRHSKESEELEEVKNYIRAFGLEGEESRGTVERSRFL